MKPHTKTVFACAFSILALALLSWLFLTQYLGYIKVGKAYYKPGDFFTDPAVKALALATQKGNLKKIDRLVKQGVDVNAIGKKDCTPLMWAVVTKNLNGVEALLKHGANPNFVEKDGMSVMSLVGSGNNIPLLKLILKYGGNPNIRDPHSWPEGSNKTVLILAAEQYDSLENVKLLLQYGAEIDATDKYGMTALLTAAFERNYEVAWYLIQKGANYKTIALFPGLLDTKINLPSIIASSLFTNNLSDDQIPYRTKIIKFLETHGIKKIKPNRDLPVH